METTDLTPYELADLRCELILPDPSDELNLKGTKFTKAGVEKLANFRQQPIAQGDRLMSVNDSGSFALHHSAAEPVAGGARRHPRLIGHRLEHSEGG